MSVQMRKYNAATTVYFPLVKFSLTSYADTSTTNTFSAGDLKIFNGTGMTNTATIPSWIGSGWYSLSLTAGEMSTARPFISIVDTATKTWEDQSIYIETYGTTTAAHAFDFNQAWPNVNVASISDDTAAADNLELVTEQTREVSATLTASQAGVTVANVTTVTTVNNLGASATAQVNAEADTALADASVTANVMNTVITNLNTTVSSRSTFDPTTSGVTLTAAQTGVTIETVSNLGASATAQVNAQVDTALTDIGLDHLVSAAVAGADVTDNSIIAKLVSNSTTADWDHFTTTSHSLRALRERGDAAWITATNVDLNADQSGVTIGTVNNLGASATAQVNAQCDTALADASVTANVMNTIITNLDQPVSSVTAAINATDVANAVWNEPKANHTTALTYGALLDATVSGISVATGSSDWTDGEKAQIRFALGVSGSTTAGSGGIIQSISSYITTNLDAAVSTRSTFDPAASGVTLTANQTGVTIATVTLVNNLGASATAQINTEADAALADASVTANVMNTVITNLDAAITSRSSFDSTTDGVTLTSSTHTKIADDVWDENISGHVSSLTAGQVAWLKRKTIAESDNIINLPGIFDGPNKTLTLPTGASGLDDVFNGMTVRIEATGLGIQTQYFQIVDYVGSTRVASLDVVGTGTTNFANFYIYGSKVNQINNLGASATAQINSQCVDAIQNTAATLGADQSAITIGTVNNLGSSATAQVLAEAVSAIQTTSATITANAVSAIWAKTLTEPTGVPAWTDTMEDSINWILALARNKITQNSTTQTLRNDADGADIATSTLSDDGTTHTRGEWT